jgi:replicative DNA helicase
MRDGVAEETCIEVNAGIHPVTRAGTYEAAGGLVYLSELSLATQSSAHIEHYARIVLENAIRRRYIAAAQQVAELAWRRRKDIDELKHLAEAAVLGASSETLSRRAVFTPGRVDCAFARVPGTSAQRG